MLLAIFVLAVLLFINGVLAMSELAMMTARQSRLQKSAASGSKGAATALRLARDPTRFLSTVQVGITLVGILAGAYGENTVSAKLETAIATIPALEPWADAISLVIVVMAITYFSLVLGELVPKRLALAYPETVATIISRPLALMSVIGAWPVRLLSFSTNAVLSIARIKAQRGEDVSEEDVRSLVARAAGTGVFTRQEHAIFNRLLRVGDLTVRDLMVPRTEIVWVDESATTEEMRVLIGTSPYSHFPVCRGSIESLIGVVHIKDLIAYGILSSHDFKITAVATKPLFVPETTPALRLLDQFTATRVHIAFVVDEHGVIQGLITLNDVVGSLVGDMTRRGEEPAPTAIRRNDGSWLVDGRLPLVEFLATVELSPHEADDVPDVSTAAGVVLALLGHLPREGERLDWRGWRFEVIDMDGARIDKILATRVPGE